MVCSKSHPEPSLLSRATRARLLQAALDADGGGRLVLVAESATLRHMLISIAGVLTASVGGCQVQIRVVGPGAAY